jgi:hypothetical protein
MVFAIQSELKAFDKLFKIKEGDEVLKTVQSVMKLAFHVKVVRQHGDSQKKAYHVAKFDNDKLHKLMVKR